MADHCTLPIQCPVELLSTEALYPGPEGEIGNDGGPAPDGTNLTHNRGHIPAARSGRQMLFVKDISIDLTLGQP